MDTWKSHRNGYMHISLKMDTWKSHENVFMPISWILIHANVMDMYTFKSHGNVSIRISWKCIHANVTEMDTWESHPNLMNMDTCKPHGIVYMPISYVYIQISWTCIHANLMKMYKYESHGNAYMHISWKCIHLNLMEMYTCKSLLTKRPVKMENDLMVGEYKSNEHSVTNAQLFSHWENSYFALLKKFVIISQRSHL